MTFKIDKARKERILKRKVVFVDDNELFDVIERLSDETGVPKSSLVRQMIHYALDNMDSKDQER